MAPVLSSTGSGSSAAATSSSTTQGDTPLHAILYGSPGLPCFGPLHAELVRLHGEASGGMSYAFRPLLQSHCEVRCRGVY